MSTEKTEFVNTPRTLESISFAQHPEPKPAVPEVTPEKTVDTTVEKKVEDEVNKKVETAINEKVAKEVQKVEKKDIEKTESRLAKMLRPAKERSTRTAERVVQRSISTPRVFGSDVSHRINFSGRASEAKLGLRSRISGRTKEELRKELKTQRAAVQFKEEMKKAIDLLATAGVSLSEEQAAVLLNPLFRQKLDDENKAVETALLLLEKYKPLTEDQETKLGSSQIMKRLEL